MNDIINTSNQTPIEIALGIDENGYTTARALYEFLSGEKSHFSRWAKKNIEENEYFEENVDWWGFATMASGNECKDYRLTTDFAKHLSMESHSAKGKIARQYFLKVEEKLKEAVRRTVPMTIPEQIQLLAQGTVELNQRVDALDEKLERFELDLPVLPIEADRITEAVKHKGTAVLGGKDSNAYADRSIRQKVYSNIHSNLRYQFQVKSYKSIKRNQVDKAIDIIGRYEPPVFLQNEIDSENAQQRMF